MANLKQGIEQLKQESQPTPIKYYKHPRVSGVWHRTGITDNRNGKKLQRIPKRNRRTVASVG